MVSLYAHPIFFVCPSNCIYIIKLCLEKDNITMTISRINVFILIFLWHSIMFSKLACVCILLINKAFFKKYQDDLQFTVQFTTAGFY